MDVDGTFVGRADERRILDQVLEKAERGDAGVVQITGEPGIGKTRLLGKLHERAERAGLAVLSSRGTEFVRDVPYGVLTELVEDLLSGPHRTALDGMPDRAALTAMLPSEAELAEGSVERYRRHRAVRQALELVARR